MLQVNVICPTSQHNGTSNLIVIEHIELAIAKRFGGYTAMPVNGAWYDDETGHLYKDESILVSTYVETDEKGTEEQKVQAIHELAIDWAIALQQIALTVTVSPIAVSYVAGTRVQAQAA